MSKTIRVDSDGTVLLSHFINMIDISKIKYYRFIPNKDGTLTIKFYDKSKRLVKPYARK